MKQANSHDDMNEILDQYQSEIGQYPLRLPKKLTAKARERARLQNRTFNMYVRQLIENDLKNQGK